MPLPFVELTENLNRAFQKAKLPDFVNKAVEKLPLSQYNFGVRVREELGQKA